MKNEIFKQIPEAPDYSVSNLGRIRSSCRNNEKIIRPVRNKVTGYYTVLLYTENGRKRRYLSRLVAQAYLENPLKKKQVNHIDGDKSNNTATNLEYSTAKENCAHAFKTGLSKGKGYSNFKKDEKIYHLFNTKTLKCFVGKKREFRKATSIAHKDVSRLCNGIAKSAKGWTLLNAAA